MIVDQPQFDNDIAEPFVNMTIVGCGRLQYNNSNARKRRFYQNATNSRYCAHLALLRCALPSILLHSGADALSKRYHHERDGHFWWFTDMHVDVWGTLEENWSALGHRLSK